MAQIVFVFVSAVVTFRGFRGVRRLISFDFLRNIAVLGPHRALTPESKAIKFAEARSIMSRKGYREHDEILAQLIVYRSAPRRRKRQELSDPDTTILQGARAVDATYDPVGALVS